MRDVAGVDQALLKRLPDNDEILARSIGDRPVVLGFGLTNAGNYRPPVKAGFAFTGESPFDAPPRLTAATPLRPQLEARAAGLGHISLNPGSRSAVVRSVPLLLSDGEQLYPNLALEALRVAQGASTYIVAGAPDAPDTITLIKVGEFVVPVTAAGELWLYVSPDRAERYVSAGRVLAPGGVSAETRAAIEGGIVFVGTSAAGLQDIRTTALGHNVPGVSRTRRLSSRFSRATFSPARIGRTDWRSCDRGCRQPACPADHLRQPGRRACLRPPDNRAALVASWSAFLYAGLLFDPLAPILAGSITHFAATAYRFLVIDRERRVVRRAFGQYLSPSLLYRIEHTQDALRLGGDDRELTIMFVDVRNFTEISERLTPGEVVRFLNTLLDALSRHVIANEGTLDKFIGDSIMAFWNAPVDVADHPGKAVRAALAMRETLARLNESDAFGFGSDQKVAIGVGIHTGLACVGNMGAEMHFNYSAVGDAVNIAARIEAACKDVGFDILISETTADLGERCAVLEAGALALKGKSTRTRVYAVVGDEHMAASAEFSELQRIHEQLIGACVRGLGRAENSSMPQSSRLRPCVEDIGFLPPHRAPDRPLCR